MSTEVAVRPADTLGDKVAYAKHLAQADLLPPAYRAKPANVLLAVETGEALNIKPLTAINMIHVIDGKPSMSAQLMAALVRQAGHRLRVQLSKDQTAARATLIRFDDPAFEFEAIWTIERAKQAGLTSKANWRSYPPAMLKARAISEVCRDACPEVLAGITYTPEELGAQELTDDEANDMGVMTRHQRVEHTALHRDVYDRPRDAERLTEPDPDDPWMTSPADSVPTAASGNAAVGTGTTPVTQDDTRSRPERPPSTTAEPVAGSGDRTRNNPRAAGAASGRGAQPPASPAQGRLADLWRQLSLSTDEQNDIIAWLCPAWTGSRSDVQLLASSLSDYLQAADGDVEEARSQLWHRYHEMHPKPEASGE